MNGFNPYITFDGTCEEAMNFYKDCFGGKIIFIQYYDDGMHKLSSIGKNKVMHCEFHAPPVILMACDKAPGQNIHQGTNITLYISFSNDREQEDAFERLSDKGVVHLALEPTFWGSRLGILTDRFGIHWMLVLNR